MPLAPQRYQAQLAAARNPPPQRASGQPAEHRAADGVAAAHAPSSAPRPQAPPVITIEDDTDSVDDSSSGDEDADVPLAARIAAQPPRLVPALGDASQKRTATQAPGINAEEVTLDIVCGGVVAKLVLPPRFKRNQARVLYAGSIITPSQFEASCGRVRSAKPRAVITRCSAVAHADLPQDVRKKWRSTLRVLCADGTEGVSVGKWMAANVEAGATAPPPAPAPPAPPPASPAPPPAAKSPAAEAAERLHAQVEALIGEDSVLLADQAATFVQVLAGAETLAARTFTTRVLEQTVQLVSADAPVLVALVESEALTPLEAFVEAAAGERDAELLLRTLRLLDALPVTLAALQRCGLGKRCNKLQKFSASAGLADTPAAAAAGEVDKAAARLVAKWKAQVNAETATAPAPAAPAAKKARVTPPAAAPAKPARALADDDMFNGPAKAKAAPVLVRPTVRVSIVSDAEARALAARAAAPSAATTSVSPRLAPGAPPSGVAAMPAMERLARERAAREAAAAAAAAQRAAEYILKERKAVEEAQFLFSDLYPGGVLEVPEVLSTPPPGGPLTSNIPSMHVPPAERAPRDRKRKRKGVVWAPEASLLQVRVFKKDEPLAGESVAYPDPATAGLGAVGGDVDMTDMPSHFAERVAQRDSAAERRTAESWRQRLPDPMYVAPPLMTAVHAWWCPPPARLAVPLPGENVLPPACGEGSSERQTQRAREASRPPVVYPTLAAVPDYPAQGPARAERPVDNSKAPVINAGDPAPVALPMPVQQQYAPPPQPMPMQMQMPQQQPSYGQMPMQQQQPQQAQTLLQQQLFNQMLGMPQQQPMQQMSAPQQQPMQPQMAWMGQQPMQPQVQQMQQPPMQQMQQPQMQMQQPQMQQQMQAPLQQGLGGWMQQPQAAPPPQQQMPAVSGLLQEWIMKSAGAPTAQQPAPAGVPNALFDLLRSLEAGNTNSAPQQAHLQVGTAPAPAAVPGPRPPPGPPPAAAHAPAMIGQWPQPQQQQQQMYSAPPPQSSFTSTLPQPSFFDRTPLPNTGLPPQGSGGGNKRGQCAFFNTARGCRNGDACKVSSSRAARCCRGL